MRSIELNREHPLSRKLCAWFIADNASGRGFRELVNPSQQSPVPSATVNYQGKSSRNWTSVGSADFVNNGNSYAWTAPVYFPRGAHSFIFTGSFRGTTGSAWAAFRDSSEMGIYVAGAPTKWYIHTSGLWLIDSATSLYTSAIGPEIGYHIAVTIDGTGGSGSRKGYTDGRLFGSDNCNGWSGSGGTRTVYLAGDAYNQPWAGGEESIRYFDGVLSAEEVFADYQEYRSGYPGMLRDDLGLFMAALGGAGGGGAGSESSWGIGRFPGPSGVPLWYQQITCATATDIPVVSGANAVYLSAEIADVRFKDDGTNPSSTVGFLLRQNDPPILYAGSLSKLRVIEASAGAKLNISYRSI